MAMQELITSPHFLGAFAGGAAAFITLDVLAALLAAVRRQLDRQPATQSTEDI